MSKYINWVSTFCQQLVIKPGTKPAGSQWDLENKGDLFIVGQDKLDSFTALGKLWKLSTTTISFDQSAKPNLWFMYLLVYKIIVFKRGSKETLKCLIFIAIFMKCLHIMKNIELAKALSEWGGI